MVEKAEQGRAAPDVVPGYGEADDEAASMAKAAHDNESRKQTGTTETDVKGRIAETAAREASKPAGAG